MDNDKKKIAIDAIKSVLVLMLEENAHDVRAMWHSTAIGGLDIYNILTGENITLNELIMEVKNNGK